MERPQPVALPPRLRRPPNRRSPSGLACIGRTDNTCSIRPTSALAGDLYVWTRWATPTTLDGLTTTLRRQFGHKPATTHREVGLCGLRGAVRAATTSMTP